jgi:hypothetical protein
MVLAKNKPFIFFISLLFLFSCAPSRFVRPLKKGEQQVNASLGGPLIHFAGTVIPMPFTTVCYGYGINNGLTAFGSIHTTAALFGNFQTDIGVVKSIYINDSLSFGVTAAPVINLAAHKFKQDFKCWPQLDANVWWRYTKREHFFYAGISNWVELQKIKAHGEKQPDFYFLNAQLGHTFVNKKWNFNLEIKLLVPGTKNTDIVVDYARLFGNRGATGAFFSVSRKF